MTRKIDGIIIHCSATKPDWYAGKTPNEQMKEIDRWHREERGWRMIGYHATISRDGTIVQGRPYEMQGAHAKGSNKTTIGICLIGGFGSSAEDRAIEHYTAAQLAALYGLIQDLRSQYGIKQDKVIGHNRVSGVSKACPGFRVQRWLAGQQISEATDTKPERTKPTQSKTVKASAATVAASAGSAATALSGLGDITQYIILGFTGVSVLLGIYIMRERIRAWAEGWH